MKVSVVWREFAHDEVENHLGRGRRIIKIEVRRGPGPFVVVGVVDGGAAVVDNARAQVVIDEVSVDVVKEERFP